MGAAMNVLRSLFILVALLLSSVSADAANRFATCAVTCTWDASDTTMWGAASGGTGASVPGSGDAVILDTATCVGAVTCTITVNTTVTVQSITMGTCTASTTGCILDFSANNNNVTLSVAFSGTGTGTRSLLMGNGTWTLSGSGAVVWDLTTVTNLTFNANSSTLDLAATSTSNRTFVGGGRTYNAFAITNPASSPWKVRITGANTFASWTFTNLRWFELAAGITQIINGAITYSGTSSAQSALMTDGATATISVGSAIALSWLFIQSITKAGAGSITATNAFNGGNNSGVTITAPTGGARIIGG